MVFTFLRYKINKLFRLHGRQVLTVTVTRCDCALLNFLITDNQHVGNLLQLGFANLETQLFITNITLNSYSGITQLPVNILGKRHLIIGHSDNNRLNRRNPERKTSGKMLNEYTD